MTHIWKTALFFIFFIFFVFGQNTCPGDCNGHGTCSEGLCVCEPERTGVDCSISLHPLSSGIPLEARTGAWTWDYYMITNPNFGSDLKVEIKPVSSLDYLSDCDIFVRKGELPESGVYDTADTSWGTTATVVIQNAETARYYIGVYANLIRCHYQITATLTACPQGCNHGTCLNDGTCSCNTGWSGPTCEDVIQGGTDLPLWTTVSGEVNMNEWVYYEVTLQATTYLLVTLNITNTITELHDCDLYLRRGEPPTFVSWDYKDASTKTSITLEAPNAMSGKWYIGIWGYNQCNFKLRVTEAVSACSLTKCSSHGTCLPPCRCSEGYSGDSCQNKTVPLQTGEKVSGYVSQGSWNYYQYVVDGSQENIIITVNQDSVMGDCDLFVRLDGAPSSSFYDYLDTSTALHTQLEIEDVIFRTLYIGVFGYRSIGYELQITKNKTCPNGCSHGYCVDGGTCVCYTGWFGIDCSLSSKWLTCGQAVQGNITEANEWIYYEFRSTATTVIVSMKEQGYQSNLSGVLYLFIAKDKTPTLRSYDYMDIDLNKQFHTIQMTLDDHQYKQSNWTIGVYGSIYVGGAVPFELVYWEPRE